MHKFFKFFLLFIIACTNLLAVIECQRLHEILPLIDEETLVVFNINNVLTVSRQDAGSTPWAEQQIAQIAAENNFTKTHATNVFIPLWHEILIASDVELFDPQAEAIVNYLQSKNVKVMALTNRYVEMAYPTHHQLRSVGIDFSKNPPHGEDFFIEGTVSPTKYIEGIIFNGLINFKGDSLVAFLKQINYFPKKIIYIEDKPKHLAQVEKAVEELGISFVGIHFGALDLQRQSYQPKLADLQVKKHFDILDDASAYKLYSRSQKNQIFPENPFSKEKEFLPSTIKAISSLKEIQKELIPKALIVTELDHVLWETSGTIGSRAFLDYTIKRYIHLGYTQKSAQDKAARLFEKIHRRAQVYFIDPETKEFFKVLPSMNCWSVAISYRPLRLLERTIEQANQLEISFNSPFKGDFLQSEEIICSEESDNQFVKLKNNLSMMSQKPALILGISSRLSDLVNLQNIANENQLSFKGYFYCPIHARKDLLNDEILAVELEMLDRLLTNEEVAFLLEN